MRGEGHLLSVALGGAQSPISSAGEGEFSFEFALDLVSFRY